MSYVTSQVISAGRQINWDPMGFQRALWSKTIESARSERFLLPLDANPEHPESQALGAASLRRLDSPA